MTWVQDPRLFNYVLMVLFAAAAVRWAFHGSWSQALYWFASLLITIAVTWRD